MVSGGVNGAAGAGVDGRRGSQPGAMYLCFEVVAHPTWSMKVAAMKI
mgnify:CR=1 FL=1